MCSAAELENSSDRIERPEASCVVRRQGRALELRLLFLQEYGVRLALNTSPEYLPCELEEATMVQGWSARLVTVPCLTVLTLLLVSVATAFGASGPADVVLHNGKIYTADPSRSVRQAIAFTGNTIVAAGTDAEVAPLIGPRTVVIDLMGKLVLPGLIDNHIHPIIGAVNGSKCSLARIKATVEAIRPVIQDCIRKQPGGPNDWIEAVQLDNYGFAATAADLDAIEAERSLVLEGNDGHTMWINSRGLEIVGVTAATPDPPGGKITRDASGAPTGAFSDTATLLVEQTIPAPSLDEQAAL